MLKPNLLLSIRAFVFPPLCNAFGRLSVCVCVLVHCVRHTFHREGGAMTHICACLAVMLQRIRRIYFSSYIRWGFYDVRTTFKWFYGK